MSSEPSTQLAPKPSPELSSAVLQRDPTFDIRNPSMMVRRPGILVRLLGALFFWRVSFDDAQVEKIKDSERAGATVYVMPSQSLLDYLYFNWAFLKKGLPLAVYGEGMRMWPFRTMGALLRSLIRRLFRRRKVKTDREILFHAPLQNRSVVVFLRKARAILPWWGEFRHDPLRPLLEASESIDKPIYMVPVLLVWERMPGQFRRTAFDKVFGDPDAPGRLRKILNFLGNHHRAFVQVGEAISIQDFAKEHAHLERTEAVGQKLRWALNQRFRVERKAIRGPVLKNSATIREEILRLEPFAKRLRTLAADEGETVESARKRASAYLREIVSDWKLGYIEFMCILMTFIFSRIYAGIEYTGLAGVREAAKRAPLVVLPAHKSHMDYLLVSFVFYADGLVPPHIAAGVNLNFWPLGHIFRRSGAFFLRRSFRQDPLYAATFETYVHKLLKEGYSMEFFLEGGRSRTGKLLRPRFGLLRTVVDAVVKGHTHDLSLCPAAIGYERIVEGEEYARELSGASKEKENLGQLFGATRVLSKRFGRVYLNFPEPFSLREFLIKQGVDLEVGFEDAEQQRRVVKQLAYRVFDGINTGTVVNASSVVAMALLGNPRRGLSRNDLLRRVGALINYFRQREVPLASTLATPLAANRVALERTRSEGLSSRAAALAAIDGDNDLAFEIGKTVAAVVDETTSLFVQNKYLTRREYGADEDASDAVIQVRSDRRIDLDYYKNNCTHLFVRESMLACTLLRCWREDDLFGDRLRKETRFLSHLLRLEYVFPPGRSFDEQYRETLKDFEDAGLLQADRSTRIVLERRGFRTLRLLTSLVLPLIEGYYIMVTGLRTLTERTPDSEFFSRLQQQGDRRWRQGELTYKESISSVTFANALVLFKDDGYIEYEYAQQGRKRIRYICPGPALETGAEELEELIDRIGRFLIAYG